MGIEEPVMFCSTTCCKKCLEVLKGHDLWVEVVHQKYIQSLTINEWFISTDRSTANVSTIWKVVLRSFDLIKDWLAWTIGNGNKVENWEW